MKTELYKTKFEDLKLPEPTRTGTFDFSEEADDLIDNLVEYEGSRIYGAVEMIATGTCPECCGNSCMDADYENGEDSCNGSYNHDCSQGEMTDASWLTLYKYDSFQNTLKQKMTERRVS
tara:strand:+ start:936 stop:1292 length:357 start_codon:yes stop_codon:yes gene_type:complete